jgi:thiosulfate/3-mercaptopyruvate sulfurtransferase
MHKLYTILFLLLSMGLSGCSSGSQEPHEKLKGIQMMEPAQLAAALNDNTAPNQLVISMGPMPELKGALDVGAGEDPQNIKKLKGIVKDLPKNTSIVIYCGCCPFDRCPNVVPAIRTLTDMGFTNGHLLNLATNFKTDWIDKGYPVK